MASSNRKAQLAAIFTREQQELIGQIFNTKISEIIASGGLVCSHCSNSSSSQLPCSPADSKVLVPTAPLQAIDKKLTKFKHQLLEQETKLQQFIDNHSYSEANISSPSTSSVATNLSTSANLIEKLARVEQRVTDLEYSFKQLESSIVQISSFKSKSRNVDYTRLLNEMHAKFETAMSKLQPALQQTISHQQQLKSTTCKKSEVGCKSDSRSNMVLEQDANKLTVLHSVAVDRHELLSTLVSNIGHEYKYKELAEFVRQLSQSTASADDVVELKAIVECMARVTGMSEHKAEQLITQFIGKERVELEHLKREQRLADDKIRELFLARDQIKNMRDSAYHNHLPYLNVVTETVQRECERYKHDLYAMAKSLNERVNAKVAQAIQQSLVDQHEQNNRAQFGLPSTERQNKQPGLSVTTSSSGKISTEMADDVSTVLTAASAAASLQDETEPKRHQNTHTQIKGLAVTSDSRSGSPFEQVAEPLSVQQLTTTQQQQQYRIDDAMPWQSIWPIIKCAVVGHKSAEVLIRFYVDRRMGSSVTFTPDGISVEEHVPVKNKTFKCKLCLASCIDARKLKRITVCDVIVICFSVINQVSYEDVQNVWLKRIKIIYPDVPYLLVGTQVDQRQCHNRNFQVESEQGLQLSQEIGAVAYFECSFLDAHAYSVEIIFEYALQHFVDHEMTLLNMK